MVQAKEYFETPRAHNGQFDFHTQIFARICWALCSAITAVICAHKVSNVIWAIKPSRVEINIRVAFAPTLSYSGISVRQTQWTGSRFDRALVSFQTDWIRTDDAACALAHFRCRCCILIIIFNSPAIYHARWYIYIFSAVCSLQQHLVHRLLFGARWEQIHHRGTCVSNAQHTRGACARKKAYWNWIQSRVFHLRATAAAAAAAMLQIVGMYTQMTWARVGGGAVISIDTIAHVFFSNHCKSIGGLRRTQKNTHRMITASTRFLIRLVAHARNNDDAGVSLPAVHARCMLHVFTFEKLRTVHFRLLLIRNW